MRQIHVLDGRRTHITTYTTVRIWVTDGEAVWTVLGSQDTRYSTALVLDESGDNRKPIRMALPRGRVIDTAWLGAVCVNMYAEKAQTVFDQEA